MVEAFGTGHVTPLWRVPTGPTPAPGAATRPTLAAVAGPAPAAAAVREATMRLAERHDPTTGTTGCWQVSLTDGGDVALDVRDGRVAVLPGLAHAPDAVLRTDTATWLDVVDGRTGGIEAFLDGRLAAEGDLHRAVRLETLFHPAHPEHRAVRARHTDVGGLGVASLVAGSGTPVLLLHGLAANSLSFLPTMVALARRHEVHVLDLPGFGTSDKPLPTGSRYGMRWQAERVRRYVVANGLGPVHVVGNSMGGRIAVELGLRAPASVRSITALCPAIAFDELQPLRPLLRLARPQWAGLAPLPLSARRIESFIAGLFHDPARVPTRNITAAAQDVATMLRDPRYRLATAAAARHLGAEPASGRRSYWSRLARLEPPSLWLWGRQDPLVPHTYAARVEQALPHAHSQVWDAMGHVPQFERPEETHDLVGRFLERIDARHPASPRGWADV